MRSGVMRKRKGFPVLILILIVGIISWNYIAVVPGAAANDTKEEAVGNLKIMVTGDLHGQVTAMQYETKEEDPTAGLSKIATLIQRERMGSGNSETVLVDAGDTLYSYATDFFYNYNDKLIQPIYQAMAMLDYDAITLGNHELDFPWEYLTNQLMESGLYPVTTVANLRHDVTGEEILPPSIVTEKMIEMSDGTVKKLRIGIVGATRQSISTKRQRYSGFLCGTDIYEAVKEEATRLKEDGVDVVIALIHGGIGLKDSTATVSPGAKLAQLSVIDAVVTSHTHEEFPMDTDKYKGYKYVDEEMGLIHGKPVIAVGSHAENLGVIEFEVRCDAKGKTVLDNGFSYLVNVSENTEEDEDILAMHERFQRYLTKKLDDTQYKLAEGCVLTNVDCVVNDSALYQLINNAKISFGTSYIQEYLPSYASYPVIAVTKNELDNKGEYLMVEDSISSVDVAKVIGTASSERPSGYLYLYKITGANLREWLEYSASIYAKKGTKLKYLLPTFTKRNPSVSTLIQEEYLQDWSSLFVFDGISYEIDLTQPARFKADGTMVSYKNKRIVNLKYQGKEVTDKQEFIIVSDVYTMNYWFMPKDTDSIYNNFPWVNGKDVVMDYIRAQAELGPISIEADNNWKFKDSDGYEFSLGTWDSSQKYGKKQDWYYKTVSGLRAGLQFFWGRYQEKNPGFSVLLSKGVTKGTGQYVPIKVSVVSLPAGASVKSMVYRRGSLTDVDDPNWELATGIDNAVFNVSSNGVYSVLVTDSSGNRTIARICISNINPGSVDKPSVEVVTNRMREVNGVAIPGSTVWVETEGGQRYSAVAAADGKFKVAMAPQVADSYIHVWTEEGTRSSEKVKMMIYRTGPNIPTLFDSYGGEYSLLCFPEENHTIAVLKGKTVYIEKGMSSRYKKSSIYNASYSIVEVEGTWFDDGSFEMQLPIKLKTGEKFYFYALDWQNRASLRSECVVK